MRSKSEKVETEEQLAFLREQQCDEFQGYLLSRPVPADELLEFFSQHEHRLEAAARERAVDHA